MARDPSDPSGSSPRQFYCVVNTLLSLLGSCVAAFGTSAALEGGWLDFEPAAGCAGGLRQTGELMRPSLAVQVQPV